MSFTEEEEEAKITHTTADRDSVEKSTSPKPTTRQQKQKNTSYQENLKAKLENCKNFSLKIYNELFLPGSDATKSMFATCWQYPEFKFGLCIFGLLSVIPISIFLLFVSIIVSSTTVLLSCVWTFIIFSAITTGLVILVPFLFASSIMAAIIAAGYYIYVLLQNKHQQHQTQLHSN